MTTGASHSPVTDEKKAGDPGHAETRRIPRLGFAGLGWIGRNRMAAVAGAGTAEIAYLCDPVADLSNESAVNAGSFEELIASDAEGIVIATPSGLHAGQAVAALERGKAVFCQKPLGRNAAETRRVIDAARANDRLLGVDLSYRFTDAMQAVHKLVREKTIGDVYAVDLVFHNAYGPDKPWFYDASLAGGGCLIDLGIHLIDTALWMLDFPHLGHVAARLHHHGGHAVEDYAAALLDLDGVTVHLACSWNLPAGRECEIRTTFYGSLGAAAFHNTGGSFYDFIAEHYVGTTSSQLTKPGDAWGGRAIVDWVARLARSRSFDPEIATNLAVAEALDAIYRAAESGPASSLPITTPVAQP
jgi:predicted dehydrogenase